MHPYHQANNLIGIVYVHPVSKQLVVLTDHDSNVGDPILTWRSVTGDERGRVLGSTVLKGDGRFITARLNGIASVYIFIHAGKYSNLLPYHDRS